MRFWTVQVHDGRTELPLKGQDEIPTPTPERSPPSTGVMISVRDVGRRQLGPTIKLWIVDYCKEETYRQQRLSGHV